MIVTSDGAVAEGYTGVRERGFEAEVPLFDVEDRSSKEPPAALAAPCGP